MKIYIFGNQDIKFDSLPLCVLPELKKIFPDIFFETMDPNEDLEIEKEIIIIDSVVGIKEVKMFLGLSEFVSHPHASLHDFDLYSHLKYLEKLGKLKKIKIIGVPPIISRKKALNQVSKIIASQLLKNARRSSYRGRKP